MLNFLKSLLGLASTDKVALQTALANGATVIDVRSAQEFLSGHFKGAKNIPLDKLATQIDSIKKMDKGIVICCASGMRSARAKSFLETQGIANVQDAGGWQNLTNLT
jgi:phage shock protein E